MTRWIGIVVVAAMTAVSGIGLAAQQRSGGAPAAADGLKAIGSVHDVMVAMVMPASDAVFNAGAEPPKAAAEWETLRHNAIILAESANLLMFGTRVRDRGEWMTMALAQRDAAEAVAKAATAKDAAALSEAGDKAYETCTTCHNKYWANRNQPK